VLLRNLLRIVQNRQAQLQHDLAQQSDGPAATSDRESSLLPNAKTQTKLDLAHTTTDAPTATMNGAAS
jgi:hypothetical protein